MCNRHITADEIVPLMVRPGISTFLEGQIGLIAVATIEVGTIIGKTEPPVEGCFCPWSEYDKLDQETRKWVDDFCLTDPNGFYTIENPHHWPIMWYMNHHCDGNVGFGENDDFVAIRQISPGEEVVYDYGLGDFGPRLRLECRCGAESCRGVITGDDWKTLISSPEKRKYMLSHLRQHTRESDS